MEGALAMLLGRRVEMGVEMGVEEEEEVEMEEAEAEAEEEEEEVVVVVRGMYFGIGFLFSCVVVHFIF